MVNKGKIIACIEADSREALVASVRRFIECEEYKKAERDPKIKNVALSLEMCGKRYNYKTLNDIPHKSVPCHCGNSKHWIIKYK
ncbi:hypothetical protein LCGC14_2375750 [marine sediment metagenome]|uniref:Uncharacterized protein n=1 Tax=marine sediment metagenome TaxID=412755 RepID=A0A0F9C2G5_9ZZZZ